MQLNGPGGASIVIKGELSAQEDVAIAGRLEGSIKAGGHRVVVSAGAVVVADIEASEIVIAGQVQGSAVGARRVELTATAEMEGEVHAPAVSVADGALFKGQVETQRSRSAGLSLAS